MVNNFTSAAFDSMQLLTKTFVKEGNRPYQNAEALLSALMKKKMLTPGNYVCRAVVQHRPELFQQNTAIVHLLEKDVTEWSKKDCSAVAKALTETFGPIRESGNIGWAGILSRDAGISRTGSHGEFFKTAICLDLSEPELILLFLLNGQSPTVHDVLDLTYFAMRKHYVDNLTWSRIMEVLRKVQKKEKEQSAQDARAAAAQRLQEDGTTAARNLLTELENNTLPDDEFEDFLVKKLVENQQTLMPFVTDDGKKPASSPDTLAGYVKTLAGERSYSKSSAQTLCSMLLVLRALYGDFEKSYFAYSTWNDALDELLPGTEGCRRNTDEAGHERLTKVCAAMLSCIGCVNIESSREPDAPAQMKALENLMGSIRNMEANVRDALGVLKGGPAQKDFTHTDIMILTYFLVMGLIRERPDLAELEERVETMPEETAFTRVFGEITNKVEFVLCDEFSEPNERLTAVEEIFNDVLDAFSQSGFYRIAPVYFPYELDALLTVALLCPPQQLNDYNFCLEDLMDDLLHTDSLRAESADAL